MKNDFKTLMAKKICEKTKHMQDNIELTSWRISLVLKLKIRCDFCIHYRAIYDINQFLKCIKLLRSGLAKNILAKRNFGQIVLDKIIQMSSIYTLLIYK